jgi:hypothetical protein
VEVVAGALKGVGDAAESLGQSVELDFVEDGAAGLGGTQYTGGPQHREVPGHDRQVDIEAVGQLGYRAGAAAFGQQVEEMDPGGITQGAEELVGQHSTEVTRRPKILGHMRKNAIPQRVVSKLGNRGLRLDTTQ